MPTHNNGLSKQEFEEIVNTECISKFDDKQERDELNEVLAALVAMLDDDEHKASNPIEDAEQDMYKLFENMSVDEIQRELDLVKNEITPIVLEVMHTCMFGSEDMLWVGICALAEFRDAQHRVFNYGRVQFDWLRDQVADKTRNMGAHWTLALE